MTPELSPHTILIAGASLGAIVALMVRDWPIVRAAGLVAVFLNLAMLAVMYP